VQIDHRCYPARFQQSIRQGLTHTTADEARQLWGQRQHTKMGPRIPLWQNTVRGPGRLTLPHIPCHLWSAPGQCLGSTALPGSGQAHRMPKPKPTTHTYGQASSIPLLYGHLLLTATSNN
jgi:hypothetical protein